MQPRTGRESPQLETSPSATRPFATRDAGWLSCDKHLGCSAFQPCLLAYDSNTDSSSIDLIENLPTMAENRDTSENQADEDGLPMDSFSVRMRNYTAPDPSPRNPRISRHSSHADRIEAQMQANGHQTWGYVIYRTTYDSEADWAELLRRLRFQMNQEMEFYNGQDILDLFTWTIFDDHSLFDGADTATIRRHFKQWTETALRSEQQRPGADREVRMGTSPRYRFCVQVDAEALKSVVHDAPPPEENDVSSKGWVKLINKVWMPRSENPIFRGRPPDTNFYEAIEGVTDNDVGWMKCPYHSVMGEWYVNLEDLNGWAVGYRRPPAVVGYPWN